MPECQIDQELKHEWAWITVLLAFHFKWSNIHGFWSCAFQVQFPSVTREDTAKQKTKEQISIARFSLSLSLLLSTCLLGGREGGREAAAHFWNIVVCLCQTPKRLWNEEGHMKRGRVTVATVCNHTHKRKNCHERISQTVCASEPSLATPHFSNQVAFFQVVLLYKRRWSHIEEYCNSDGI